MEKNKNISDELLIGYLEKTLSNTQINKVEKALEESDKVFYRYTVLKKAYMEIENEAFEVTPDNLKDKLNLELELNKTNVSNMMEVAASITEKTEKWINIIFGLRPAMAIISTIFIGLIISKIFFSDQQITKSPINEIQSPKQISELLKSLNNKSKSYISTNDKKDKGINVVLENDTLIIQQSIRISRKVYVINNSKDLLLETKVTEKKNKIPLITIIKNDSLRVIIETAGIIVYDSWLKTE